MSLNDVNPALLVFIGAIFLAWATFNYQNRQSQNGKVTRQLLEKAIALMEPKAIQTGDNQALQEIIDARTKLLATNRPPDDAAVRQILERVPHLTEEYKKLEKNKATAANQLMTEYRTNWEPVFRVAVAEFDKRVETAEAQVNGIRVTKEDNFKVAGIEQEGGNSQLVRVAEMNGVQLRLYFTSAQIHPTHLDSGHIEITVNIPEKPENDSNPLRISFGLKEASTPNGSFAASSDSSKALAQIVIDGINKGLEEFLVLASARKQ
jgi:hypothetical protein